MSQRTARSIRLQSLGVVSGLIWFICSLPTLEAQDSLNGQIAKLEEAYRKAAIDNDIDFFKRTIADAYIGTDVDGASYNRTTLLREREGHQLVNSGLTFENQKIAVVGTTAVVSETVHVVGKKNGTDRSGDYRITRVWVKYGGGWKVLAFHGSRIAK